MTLLEFNMKKVHDTMRHAIGQAWGLEPLEQIVLSDKQKAHNAKFTDFQKYIGADDMEPGDDK